jgi:hypothetical protein
MTFTGAWLALSCLLTMARMLITSFEVYCCPTESELPVFIPRNSIYDSDDEDSVEDVTPLYADEEEVEVVGHRPKSHYWKKNKYNLDIVMSKVNTEEKDVWSEEVNCCEIKNDIDCSYWEKLIML